MVSTVPLTFGSHEVTAYGAVALKLNALFLGLVVVPDLIEVNVPTAYMVPPHCTSWRTCSVVPVSASVGVPLAGVGDAGPASARPAGAASADAGKQHAPATTPAISAPRAPRFPHSCALVRRCMWPPVLTAG